MQDETGRVAERMIGGDKNLTNGIVDRGWIIPDWKFDRISGPGRDLLHNYQLKVITFWDQWRAAEFAEQPEETLYPII